MENIKTNTILAVILIEGFVTISLEMLSIRQLIPVVGNSVIITSLIIGVFLLFLAIGYQRGGFYRKDYHTILKRNFTIAAVLLGFGLSYLFIHFFFYIFFHNLTHHALVVLSLYLLIIIAPLIYILGQTVPITTNLFRHDYVGAISGKVLALSTLGSFLGSVVTTLLLMNYVGVAWTIFFNYSLLAVLVFLLIENLSIEWFRLFLIIILGALVFVVNINAERDFFTRTNNYADYQIIKNYPFKNQSANLLKINDSPSSLLTQNREGFEYIEVIKRILFHDLALRHKQILVLGAGGFTVSAADDYSNAFTYVDVDKDIVDIVKKGGFIDTIKGKFISQDARQFLLSTKQNYDAVVSDVYSNRYAIPFHLLTREYFEGIKKILKPDGVAIFNIISNPILNNRYAKRIDNTLRSAFGNCMAIPLKYSNQLTNILYICSTDNAKDKTIYSDNLSSAPLDFFKK